MISVKNLKLQLNYKEADLLAAVSKKLKGAKIASYKITRKSLDSRKHDQIHYVISVDVSLADSRQEANIVKKVHNNNIMLIKENNYQFPFKVEEDFFSNNTYRPVVVGAGPAGYFAALKLSEAGLRPIVLERGMAVEDRKKDVEKFWEEGVLNPESNVSFGEGGAGTFSDGKLFTGNKDKGGIFADILEVFAQFGAPESITYEAKPHIGTNVLYTIMQNMRAHMEVLGAEIRFHSALTDIEISGSDTAPLYDLEIKDTLDESLSHLKTNAFILAIGHSARDTFAMLMDRKIQMQPKPFAVGLRVQHPQSLINIAMYGSDRTDLPSADYKLIHHAENGRAVFSFCMCPGGYVVNASSEEGTMVVNGMSYSGRDSGIANSAIVVSVNPEDYPGDSPKDAIDFQLELERRFYEAGAGKIPVQLLGDFANGVPSKKLGHIEPKFKGDFTLGELKNCLPDYCYDAIIDGFKAFGKKIYGYDDPDTVLAGVESRTSSPVQIIRDEHMEAIGHPGFFPSGEGAGYAGGITSAAADGIRAAEKLAAYLLNKREGLY